MRSGGTSSRGIIRTLSHTAGDSVDQIRTGAQPRLRYRRLKKVPVAGRQQLVRRSGQTICSAGFVVDPPPGYWFSLHTDRRYSCGQRAAGSPDPRQISTSFVERSNITIRVHIRRFTRLTNASSEKAEMHAAAVALHFTGITSCRFTARCA
jgi:hypothetical protein